MPEPEPEISVSAACMACPPELEAEAPQPPAIPVERPAFRRLRVFAFDPSLSSQLDNAALNHVTLRVPWEVDPRTGEDSLGSGPVGEYLEVVDFDPGSGCFYAPVDLSHRYLLARDGLDPSEGNPQFHQQMVYAVAMTTLHNFERALGRVALWADRAPEPEGAPGALRYASKPEEAFVQRLRLYPHALREANAYYHPGKKALLFGYFPAPTQDVHRHLPGGLVFTCLSHDIIAHETTHALLDGMHRRFNEPSNPDTLAFHEAFADIVALFQHFSFPEVLKHQIARTRGDLASENLLGQLAQQFGNATGVHGALRDSLGAWSRESGRWEPAIPDPAALETVFEPHARGSILVAAVFDTFVSIYRSRIADLLRIATNGTGILPAGALHPDLVDRLAREAAKSARHVLNMCIRALDYCPPIDLTFGEYLRALITADFDLVSDDDWGYRVAVVEAFRRRGIYPRDVRSLSVDSLRWQGQTGRDFKPLFFPVVRRLDSLVGGWDLASRRRSIHKQLWYARGRLHEDWRKSGTAWKEQKLLGIEMADKNDRFEIHSLRPARRNGPDGETRIDLIVEVTQKKPGYYSPFAQAENDALPLAKRALGDFEFRGGATLIVDLETSRLRYAIRKRISDADRLARQRAFLQDDPGSSLHALYLAGQLASSPFALLHRAGL
jgi:hypothetical protein